MEALPVLFHDALTRRFEYRTELSGLELPCHIEVTETHLTLVCDKQIAWLQVPMYDTVLVKEA